MAVEGGILWSEEVGVVQPPLPPSSSLLVLLDGILMGDGNFSMGRSCIKSRSISL